MPKFMPPDGDVYNPDDAPHHPNEDLFRDIPLKWERVPGEYGWIYRPAAASVLAHPATPAVLALHAELVGLRLDPELAKVRRIDPVRGGRSLTSPGIWQDVKLPIPDADPVNEILAKAAEQTMSPAEMAKAADALMAQAKAQAE